MLGMLVGGAESRPGRAGGGAQVMGVLVCIGGGRTRRKMGLKWPYDLDALIVVHRCNAYIFRCMKSGWFSRAHANTWMLSPPAGYWSSGGTRRAWWEEVAGARAWRA